MGDLWPFRGVSGAVAAGVFPLITRQLQAVVNLISLDKGMVAKIWDLEAEGPQVGDVMLEYTLDDTAGVIVWVELKRFRHAVANTPDRQAFMSRPITIDAKNDTTALRFSYANAGGALLYLTVIIEFDDIKTD